MGEGLAFLGMGAMNIRKLGIRLGGFLFPVPLTAYNVGRGRLARNLLEAIAFSLRANKDQVEEVWGRKIGRINIGGGMSRGRIFLQILADVLNTPIFVSPLPEVSPFGACICALAGAEGIKLLETPVPPSQPLEPSACTSEYEELYFKWLSAYHTLEELGREVL